MRSDGSIRGLWCLWPQRLQEQRFLMLRLSTRSTSADTFASISIEGPQLGREPVVDLSIHAVWIAMHRPLLAQKGAYDP